MRLINTIQAIYTNIKQYIYEMYSFYNKPTHAKIKNPVTMPEGFTEWDYLVQLHLR
jgi:hypothetical protein